MKKIKIEKVMWQVGLVLNLSITFEILKKKQEKRRFKLDPSNAQLGP